MNVNGRLRSVLLPTGLGIVAVALLAAVVAAVGSPDGGFGATSPQPQETPTELPTEQVTAAPEAVGARITSYEVFLARDPFEPVIPEPVTDGGATAGGTPTVPTTDPTVAPTTSPTTSPTTAPTINPTASPTASPTTSPTANPSPSDGSTPPSSGCVMDETTRCDGRTVSLVDVFTESGTPRAVVSVDQTLYEVGAGETFATNFQVRSIEPPCVTLVYGDDAFTLCEGETVLK